MAEPKRLELELDLGSELEGLVFLTDFVYLVLDGVDLRLRLQ